MDPLLAAVAGTHLPAGGRVAAPTAAVADALRTAGREVLGGPLTDLSPAATDAVVLLADELSTDPAHAEGLVAEAERVLAPGGVLLASAVNRVAARVRARDLGGLRAYTAAELDRALAHRGLVVELVCAPGAAAALARHRLPAYDPELDREPGLLGAAERVVALGRRWPDSATRTAAFFRSLPRKVVAAAVLCRDAADRVLVVHDSFKRHWTIPGGVVDADEDPRAGAAREAEEEAGLVVQVGALLGVFAGSWPDRLVFVYAASPRDGGHTQLRPHHAHEIDAAAWLPLHEALATVAPLVAFQVLRCLESPGGTWRQPGGP